MEILVTQSFTTSTHGRQYAIEDLGDSFHLSLFLDGLQVAGALFPDFDQAGTAFELAQQMGEAFVGSA